MTFDLPTIGILFVAALLYSALLPARWRNWALMVGSVIAIYWLQPLSLLRYADFVLPTVTVALAVGGWVITRKPDDDEQQRHPHPRPHRRRRDSRAGRRHGLLSLHRAGLPPDAIPPAEPALGRLSV